MDRARRYAVWVGIAGGATIVWALGALDGSTLPLVGLFTAAFAVAGTYTMIVHTGPERLHHGFETLFIVAATATVPPTAVIVAVVGGHLVGRAFLPLVQPGERGSFDPVKLGFNAGKQALSASAALALVGPLVVLGPSSPTVRLLTAALAGAVFEVVDHLVLLGLLRRLPPGAVRLPARWDVQASVLVIAGGTVLAAALSSPVPAALPVAATLAVLVPCSKVLRGVERARGQLEVTLQLLDVDEVDTAEVEARLVEAARTVTNAGGGRLGRTPPGDDELGVELVVAGHPRWLTVRDRRGTNRAFTAAEADLLRSVAAIGRTSLARVQRLAATERRARRCELTGLANRSGIRTSFEEARAHDGRSAVALLFIDLDGFKRVNDTHGHDAGDRLLVEVAHRLVGCVRERDVVGRWAGDEFVVLLTDQHAVREAEALATRIDEALRQPYVAAGGLPVSASIGVSTADAGAEELGTLVARADQRMYAAKSARAAVPPTPA